MKIKIKRNKPKPRPKPVINYPPVPTKKWIPPDKRKKTSKPEPKYVKPKGISQKLAISTLKKVWNKYDIYGDAAIITGHFSQYHRRFSFKSNGLQGACISAIACAYSHLFKMAHWTKYILNEILIRGDEIYVKSTQQGDRCLIEVPPEKVHPSFFFGNQKVTIFVTVNAKLTEELTSASEEKAKSLLEIALTKFLNEHPSGIFYIKNKYAAVWKQDGVYYYFDPGEHDEYGNPWIGQPGYGLSFLGRFKEMPSLVEYLYKNFPSAKESYAKFELIPCGIARITRINTQPPETFEDVAPQDTVFTQIIEEPPPLPDFKLENLQSYVEEDKAEPDQTHLKIQEISPEIDNDFPSDKRPSFLQEGPINKGDFCRYPIPIPSYLKGENARLTYYTEIVPKVKGILRGSTCQTNPKFSKYFGRQSIGNALSALIMLRLCKAKHWIPKIVDTILKYGDTLYRDAMLSIPRTHSLRPSNFPKKIDYEGKTFTPEIEDYAIVGQLQSQDYDIMELRPALEEFLADNDCCIILGPQILAVWVEDGVYYVFDPNERDQEGKAIEKTTIVGSNVINLEPPSGVACVLWFKNLKDLVEIYMNNTEKSRRDERFYLSKVAIKDYVAVSDDWNNFIGIDVSKWILRGTFSQASFRFLPESRNVQGTANALISLAMAVLVNEKEWTSDIIDEILIEGDSFYNESIKYLQEKGLFTNPHLMLSELKSSHKLRDKLADFDLEECIVNGLIYGDKFDDLSKGLANFFRDNEAGVLTTRKISLAIWKKNEAYYYVDSYSRDDKGLCTGYGTSCSLRFLYIEDLAKAIEANLDPDVEDYFNITKVRIILYEAREGAVKPMLNNYTEISNKSAVLRGWQSEQSDKYEVRRGRQTVPMCISAVGFNKLKPAVDWTKNDIDIILDKGDNLYVDSMVQAQKDLEASNEGDIASDNPQDSGDAKVAKPPMPASAPKSPEKLPVEDEGAGDEAKEDEEEQEKEEEQPELEIKITSENVKPEVRVGPNNIKLEFNQVAQGNIKESLRDSLKSYFELNQTEETPQQTEANFNQEALLETKHYTVALWRDDKAYYVFDPKPRDKHGKVFGMEDWESEPPEPEPEPEEEAEGEEGEGEGVEDIIEPEAVAEEEEEQEKEKDALPEARTQQEEDEEEVEGREEGADEAENEEEYVTEEEEKKPEDVKPKREPDYWLEQEKSGRACTIWFTDLDDLVKFIYENIPVEDRLKTDFSLKQINVINDLKLKNKHHHDDERIDAYSGDWYDFKELEHGKWILRGSLDAFHQLFPESNRGKQGLMYSIIALGLAHIYEMLCFHEGVPDSILVYGDKLLTFIKRSRKKQLLNDPSTNLKEDEIDWLVKHENFNINDIPKKICISKFMVEVSITPNHVQGDIKAQNFEDILDVKRGLKKFFENSVYGVLYAKGVYVAIWRGQKMFYMFDGLKRGPSGTQSPTGTACVTRYLDTDMMADVFLQNLPAHGKNEYVIHKVQLSRNLCPREREPKGIVPAPKAVAKSAGLKVVIPGKYIIKGTISQEDPRFGKGPNIMSAPIAFVALTMSLIHKPEIWSRPIIDEIVILGSELFEDSVNELGFDFNPWEDRLDVYRVKNIFKLGVAKASCELRNRDQRGIIECPESSMQNLRQGLERFFEENTHGVLITEPLTLAVWEQPQDDGDALIYIFDPNPRSSTGMPLFSGSACAVSFSNAKMASDHIIGCILEPYLRSSEFVIVPVEMVVGNAKTISKQPEKSATRSSINLPRCSKQVASEQKKKLRKLAEEDRKRKEEKKQQMIGRNGYHLKGNEALLRGYKSQNSDYYDIESRNNQDIPNCIASVVMHTVLPIEDWNYRHIDLILDTGDQLYIDSYIAYGPKDPKLGMKNILRKFFMGNLEVHITVYKPVIAERFTPSKLTTVLEAFFQQESICILSYSEQWISIFFKGGFYFMFDPHERDIEGNSVKIGLSGTAVVIRFDSINAMALKIVNNLGGNTEESETFSLWIISVQSK